VSGAQTYELNVFHPSPLQQFRLPNLSSSVSQFRPATDLTLDNPMYWYVRACTTAVGCSQPPAVGGSTKHIRSLNLPPPPPPPPTASFVTDLAPTFKHARCINCHAVAATNFARGTGTGLPANHSVVSAATNCTQSSCHTSTLLPTQGTINPGWKSAPADMDFRNKTDADLCAMAKNPGTVAGSVLNHLSQDKLVLWAVGDGRVPGGTTLATAPPNSISTWQTRVQNWVNAGMPCS
jgi:hypothetical protein